MKRPKYKNHVVTIEGITFDSMKEGNRYRELKLLERAGKITGSKYFYNIFNSFCIIFMVFLIAKPIATPLPAEVYETQKNLMAVRLIKMLFIFFYFIIRIMIINI